MKQSNDITPHLIDDEAFTRSIGCRLVAERKSAKVWASQVRGTQDGLVDLAANFSLDPLFGNGVHKPSKLRRLYPMKKDVIQIRLPSCSGVLTLPLEQKPRGGN